ncbi:MAG TPA: type I methionyl aminopeptidase [Anaerolineae bacterium]|nr:type I methionyl aminopeptidase [Anaerolineae bacterium]HQK15684.1 type I methionyl aminopeptidase [Anaerolineae bacterium]
MQKRSGLSWLRNTRRSADEAAQSVAQAYSRRQKQANKREIIIKNEVQIAGIRKSCRLTRDILDALTERIRPGITTEQINTWVHEMTLANGAIPAPLHYRGYPKSVCTSINEVICHGIPSPDRVLREGDILNVDVTTILNGYYGDSSRMFLIGEVSPEARKLVEVTRECLELGIAQVKPGNRLGDIGHAIQKHAESHGYSVVRAFVGHGTGIYFHEAPDVLHYGVPHTGIELVPGMVFTIEPMINIGTYEVRTLSDGWTAVTADGSLSAQWEHTVLVTAEGVEVLTA